MSYTGFVCQIKNLRDHPNGDNLYLGECFGNTVAVSRNGYTSNMTGVYFPTDGQLSTEFCQNNNFPLFTIPWEIHLVDIMQDYCNNILKAEQ